MPAANQRYTRPPIEMNKCLQRSKFLNFMTRQDRTNHSSPNFLPDTGLSETRRQRNTLDRSFMKDQTSIRSIMQRQGANDPIRITPILQDERGKRSNQRESKEIFTIEHRRTYNLSSHHRQSKATHPTQDRNPQTLPDKQR